MSVDLDVLEAFYSRIDFDRRPQIVALIAELRVAREVVEFARYVDADAPDPFRKFSNAMEDLRRSLRRYDQTVEAGS